jgi:putative flavoprotein involved in K+ transport
VFDDNGRVIHRRGVTAAPGLYFIGLTWQHTRGSALIGWVGDDAAYVAEAIKAFQPTVAGSRRAEPIAVAMTHQEI